MIKPNYKLTVFACFMGYIVQAVINNFAPLLFITFQNTYDIPLSQITLLITINFAVQLIVDFAAAKFVDKIGYKPSIIGANVFCAAGLICLAVLPEVLANAFVGLLLSVILYAIGGGLLEVLVSPIIENCPNEHKEKTMSLLHSFYCWGHVGVVLVSILFFYFAGIENWRILALVWAVLPIATLVLFAFAPINSACNGEKGMTIKQLFCNKTFWLLVVMMICAGASEQAVSQWASTFAELGLGISKTLGDLFGPTLFAFCMGTSRLIFGKIGHKIKLEKYMAFSCVLCVCAYLCITIVPNAVVNLISCGVCGFSVGILWPGTFSTSTNLLKRGGTAMFALLALGGDVGCMAGPTIAGAVAAASNLKIGILCAIVFPTILTVCVVFLRRRGKRRAPTQQEE